MPRLLLIPLITGLNVPFGLEAPLPGHLSLRGMYDGERSHAMLTRAWERWSASLMLIWLEQVGASVSMGF